MRKTGARSDVQISANAARVLDLEQRGVGRGPGTGAGGVDELARLLIDSEGCKALLSKNTPTFALKVPAHLLHSKTIQNTPGLNISQPFRPDHIVGGPEQRLTVRSLFTAVPVTSASVEVLAESTFSDGTSIQGNDSSPEGFGEGSLKGRSDMSLTLSQVNIPTIASYIKASRQVLDDSQLLQRHITGRLVYYLNLLEEVQFLTGAGTSLNMSGINTGASAFTGGNTNQTRVDTLARMASQLATANYEPSGYILHPADWLETMLEKDSQGRYVLGNPQTMTTPRAWGLPVIVTPSQTQGNATCIDASRFGYIADRMDAEVRLSENVADDFLRNLITIRAEKRSLLVTELGAAAVYSSLDFAG